MTIIMTIILVIIVLSALILVHELGHFIVAKRSGMTVEEFGLGYPPRVLTIATISGTAYTLNALPFGGFVRLINEDDPSVPGSFASKGLTARAVFLLAGSVTHFLLAIAIFFGSSISNPTYAQITTTRITGVAPASPAYDVGLRPDDVIISIAGVEVENDYPSLRRQVERLAGQEIEVVVERDGQVLPPIRIVPRSDYPANEGPMGVGLGVWVGIRVTQVKPGSVADTAGIRPGDILIDVANQRVLNEDDLVAFVKERAGWRITMRLARDDEVLDPIRVQIPDEVSERDAMLGLSFHPSVPAALMDALRSVGEVAASIPMVVTDLVHRAGPANSVLGPIGIAQATGEVANRLGLWGLLNVMASFAAGLAVFNLLPIPALDGGRLVFVALEALRGQRIDPRKEQYVHLIGMVLLLSLMVVITVFSDIPRLLRGESILPW